MKAELYRKQQEYQQQKSLGKEFGQFVKGKKITGVRFIVLFMSLLNIINYGPLIENLSIKYFYDLLTMLFGI